MGTFSAPNVIHWSMWGTSACQITMNITKAVPNVRKTRRNGRKTMLWIERSHWWCHSLVHILPKSHLQWQILHAFKQHCSFHSHQLPDTWKASSLLPTLLNQPVDVPLHSLIKCNKAGCKTRWVSLQHGVEMLTVTHWHHELYSFIWSACDLTSRYRTGSVSCVQHWIVAGNDRRNEMGLDNRPNHMIYTYLEGDSHAQLVSPSLEALKKFLTWYP